MSLPLVTASGYIKAGRLMFHNRRAFDSAVSGLKDGWEVEVEISRLRATRSAQQNRAYWGVIIAALTDHTGYTPEEIHEILKCKFLPKELAILKDNGDVVDKFVMGGSTRGLDTQEFGDYMERIKEWAAQELDLYIPDFDQAGYGHGV